MAAVRIRAAMLAKINQSRLIRDRLLCQPTQVVAAMVVIAALCFSAFPISAQTVDLNLPSANRQPTELTEAQIRRVQALYDGAVLKRRQGQVADALTDVEVGLKLVPRDLPLRFLRAVILNQMQRQGDALAVFESLIQEYPELPEPYNNAAVIYGQQGELGKARAALERAIQIFPKYAVAQENLGDVYLRMAQRSYAAANQSDPKLETVTAKLRLTTEWLSSQGLIAK